MPLRLARPMPEPLQLRPYRLARNLLADLEGRVRAERRGWPWMSSVRDARRLADCLNSAVIDLQYPDSLCVLLDQRDVASLARLGYRPST